jgi:dTDP-glucose pyrophosphorylase
MLKLLTRRNITIKNALKLLQNTGKKCLVIVDNEKKLLGTLTDGDLRNSILEGVDLNSTIKNIFNPKPKFLFEKKYSHDFLKKYFIKQRLDLIPFVNKDMQVIRVLTWDQVLGKIIFKKNVNLPVIIMSGGEGSRLMPFTSILPKPLIPINDKAVIQHIIDNFVSYGCNNFSVITNFKSKIIQSYFAELKTKYKVKIIKEKNPLGTVGGLSLLKIKKSPLIITNCDTLTNFNLQDFYQFHKINKNDITIAASVKNYKIPYGICEMTANGELKNILEKPNYNFLVNIGLYIINKKLLKIIPKNKYLDFSDILKIFKSNNKKIGVFPVSENAWLDIGQWEEYKKSSLQLQKNQ